MTSCGPTTTAAFSGSPLTSVPFVEPRSVTVTTSATLIATRWRGRHSVVDEDRCVVSLPNDVHTFGKRHDRFGLRSAQESLTWAGGTGPRALPFVLWSTEPEPCQPTEDPTRHAVHPRSERDAPTADQQFGITAAAFEFS